MLYKIIKYKEEKKSVLTVMTFIGCEVEQDGKWGRQATRLAKVLPAQASHSKLQHRALVRAGGWGTGCGAAQQWIPPRLETH